MPQTAQIASVAPRRVEDARSRFARVRQDLNELERGLAMLRDVDRWDRSHGAVAVLDSVDECRAVSMGAMASSSVVRSLDPMNTPVVTDEETHERVCQEIHEAEMRAHRRGFTALCVVTDNGCLSTPRAVKRQREVTRAGEQTRYAPRLQQRLSVFDDHYALVERPGGERGALLVREPQLVQLLTELFAKVYASSQDWRPDHAERDPELRERVVDLLGKGLVDEAIARRLEVSPRTVARVIAALMREHDCQTRFQLGAALAHA